MVLTDWITEGALDVTDVFANISTRSRGPSERAWELQDQTEKRVNSNSGTHSTEREVSPDLSAGAPEQFDFDDLITASQAYQRVSNTAHNPKIPVRSLLSNEVLGTTSQSPASLDQRSIRAMQEVRSGDQYSASQANFPELTNTPLSSVVCCHSSRVLSFLNHSLYLRSCSCD